MADSGRFRILAVLFCFFVMGAVDLVGIGANYVQKDLGLSDSIANLLPSMVFFWFLIFSVPVSILMNRIGRRKTVLISIAITLVGLLVPLFGESFFSMIFSFSLLGIGNTFMQTSLNPLVSNVVSGEKLPSALTFGQFVKAIASFLGPILAAWGAVYAQGFFGWRILFVIYSCTTLLSMLWLLSTPIEEEKPDKVSGFRECVSLLSRGFVFLSFLGIICHVGIDVGTNTTAPRILMERCGLDLTAAGFATSMYFVCRTVGALFGAGLLQKFSAKFIFLIGSAMICVGLVGLIFLSGITLLYLCIILVGLGNSNIFAIIFSQAMLRNPAESNEVSGLMIMGLFGGTIFPLVMGFASDIFASQAGAVAIMICGALYLLYYTAQIRAENN